jgi:hypothetical protein
MKDSFPVDFYAVSATVIPVLFLAFAVQTPFIERLRKDLKDLHESHTKHVSWGRQQFLGLLITAGQYALLCTVIGEVTALLALMNRHDNSFMRIVVFGSVVILLAEVVAVPAFVTVGLPYFYSLRNMYRKMLARAGLSLGQEQEDEPQTSDDDLGGLGRT